MYMDFFLYKCKSPVRPKEFAVVMDAIPQKVLALLKSVTVHKSYASFSSRARCLCVCECVWVCRLISADQRSSWSSSSSAAAHHTTFIYSPLSHLLCQIVVCESRLCLIPSSFQSCAFFVPVRVPVDLSLWIRHVTSTLLFTALVWPSKSLRHYPVSLWTAPIISSIGLIKREPTRILFPCFYHDNTG